MREVMLVLDEAVIFASERPEVVKSDIAPSSALKSPSMVPEEVLDSVVSVEVNSNNIGVKTRRAANKAKIATPVRSCTT